MIYLLDSNNNPVFWDFIDSSGVVESNGSLDISSTTYYSGSVSKIYVNLDLDENSTSSRTISLRDSCNGTRDEKLNCYKNKRNKYIEQIRMEWNSLSSPVSNPH